MKNVDYNYFLPIDKLKIYIGHIVLLHYNDDVYTCRINPTKIPFEYIDELSEFEQSSFIVTLERVIALTKFKDSKFKTDFEDIEIRLGNIGNVDLVQ
ncbi:hypothetical protein [uncultured Chryseobacterium sp.]|uniref:hypothetical protein n=1 Tax=uncultured Chryseobacterium sp. TaxID=259322 RepID=UPI0025F495C5|nr:hypothetical protein [uncultured Chryseobacterium sp.]